MAKPISSEMALVNTLGHDLRSPLTAVRGAATLLIQGLDEIPREKVLDLLGIIDRRVIQMSDRIEDIIAVAHLDAGDLNVYMEPLDAATIFARAARPDPQWDGLLEAGDPPHGLTVDADLERSVQVLRALIGNAFRFSEAGTPVRLTVEADGDQAAFVVADGGPGVPEDDRERVFQRLWHGEEAGPGLGLYLARGLARLMGGDVSLSSPPDGGSCFSFRLTRHG